MVKFFFSLVLAVSLLWGAGAVPAGGILFTQRQLKQLKTTGRDVIAPTYLPERFRVREIIVDRKYPKVPSYAILFVGSSNACFVIEMGTEVGDMIIENDKGEIIKPTSNIHNPLLGTSSFWNISEYMGTDWFPPYNNAAYSIKGDVTKSAFSGDKGASALCRKRMDSSEFRKVAESLNIISK